MVVLLQVLAVLAVVFGVAIVLTGRSDGMSEEAQDLADTGIPRDRPMTSQDVAGLRFALAFRGYRMDEVDEALDRLAAEIQARDDAISQLVTERSTRARAAEDPAAVWGPPSVEEDVPPGVEPAMMPVPLPLPLPLPEPLPEPEPEADPEPPLAAGADPEPEVEATPVFGSLTPPPDGPNPFRPEVPEIPTYDPWAVTPKSRYTEGPAYVEVDDEADDDEAVDAIAEHHTGYAPPPPEPGETEEPPKPPWQR